MPTNHRIQQLYGYLVCLVAIVTGLIVIPMIVDATTQRSAPLMSDRWGAFNSDLTSYEAYAIANQNHRFIQRPGPDETARVDTLTEEQARANFAVMQESRIAAVRHQTGRDLLRSWIVLAIAAALFLGHWRWVRAFTRVDGAT
jgi:hypothetical protein